MLKPDDTVEFASKVMAESNVGLVVVLDGRRLVGVISERDVVRKWICGREFPVVKKVSDVMTKDVEDRNLRKTLFLIATCGLWHATVATCPSWTRSVKCSGFFRCEM